MHLGGLDEGIHTVKVRGIGGLIIPPKLGYVNSRPGPIPETLWNSMNSQQFAVKSGQAVGWDQIFEVEWTSVVVDEASQEYCYDDLSTPEEFESLQRNFQEWAQVRVGAALVFKNGCVEHRW